MAKNIIEKIWDKHVVSTKKGFPDIFAIDLHLMHEVTSPQAFDELRKRKISRHKLTNMLANEDHIISTSPKRYKLLKKELPSQQNTLRKNTRDFEIPMFKWGSGKQGIVHVVAPEQGIVHPGMTIVCGDSHTSTHGAFGALAFGIGTTEVGHVLATGSLLRKRPKTFKVEFKGTPRKGITAKDLILKLIEKIDVSGATGYIIEYTGKIISKLSMEQRMTICNMSIECGARAGLIAPDQTTYNYLKDKPGAPKGKKWDKALKYWKSLKSDKNANYDKKVIINISNLAPVVTWGINPAQAIEINKKIPALSTMKNQVKELAQKALKYTKLRSNQKLEGLPIDYVFIGSCTNGRISDLRDAAKIMKGKKIAKGIKVFVVPGSEEVQKQAIEEGLDKIFIDTGADFREPGCSFCLAMNNEDIVPPGKRCASTSNRNFVGRQGENSITHLMSPIMAAAASITGKITDVRKIL